MAYASLLSLAQTTAEIIFLHPISQNKKQRIRSIYEPFILLQEFLEEFPEKTNTNLEGRIRDVAHEAEDIVVSLIMKETPSHWSASLAAKLKSRHQMRKLRRQIKSISREMKNIIEKSCEAMTTTSVAASQLIDSPAAASSASSMNAADTVGLQEDLVAIMYRLCGESPHLQVIPIVGMGGIGKTTLARTIYDHPMTVQHFEIRAWVTVSQDYDADVILSCLLASIEEVEKERCGLVGERVFKILKSRRYLIVIDDIWSEKAWDDIMYILPDDGNGSRVMLTTRLHDVAAYPDPYSPIHKMRLMDADQSWNLLRQKVFPHQDCPLELERIGQEIARRCSGLPLAIVVAAGLLSTVSKNQASWRDFEENVNTVVASEEILSLSYTHLPHYLKPCFLYLGMFPKGREVRVSKLIRLWVAEGFLRHPQSEVKSLEEEAEECLEDLVRRSLVLVTKRKSDGRMKTCSLHDLMRDLCIRKAHEEKFLVSLRGGYDKKFIPIEIRKNQPRVSLTPAGLPHLSNISGLTTHTILCFHSISILDFLRSFKLLRLLDTGDVYVRALPDQLFELFHLVYLGIYCLGNIPAAILKLQNLQTFNIRARNEWRLFKDHSVCLPQEIWSLPQLRHLVFYGRLPEPERSITSTLNHLQTLSIVSHVMCSERILRMTPNIRKLEIDCSGSSQGKICLKSLVNLHQLENLKLRSAFSNVFCQRDIFTFPETVRKLSLSRLPLPWDEMTVVGSLPNLRVLKLTHQACKGSTWETAEGEFPQLESLLIQNSYLEHWLTESSHFPRLKWLVLDECRELTGIPNGIGEIPTLELIEVKGKAKESLLKSTKRIREEQLEWGNDALKVRCMTR